MSARITQVWKDDVLVFRDLKGLSVYLTGLRIGVDLLVPSDGYVVELTSFDDDGGIVWIEAFATYVPREMKFVEECDEQRRKELGEWFCTASDKKAGIWR